VEPTVFGLQQLSWIPKLYASRRTHSTNTWLSTDKKQSERAILLNRFILGQESVPQTAGPNLSGDSRMQNSYMLKRLPNGQLETVEM
jgi:hypothetical protein